MDNGRENLRIFNKYEDNTRMTVFTINDNLKFEVASYELDGKKYSFAVSDNG